MILYQLNHNLTATTKLLAVIIFNWDIYLQKSNKLSKAKFQ